MYQITKYGIERLADKALIPEDEGNLDYQNYLKWVEEGNAAQEAPESKEEKIAKLKRDLDEIDRKSIRALREKDDSFLKSLTEKAIEARTELKRVMEE